MTITAPPKGETWQSDEDLYPSSDGKPMGETDKHIVTTFNLLHMLKKHFADRPDVYVAGNNFIYYEEGNSDKSVSPDGYVVFGVPKRLRDTYITWQEGGRLPAIVFEITSRTTKRVDLGSKMRLYQDVLHIPEYFLFDPRGKVLPGGRVQGFRLANGIYAPIVPEKGMLYSEQLGLYVFEHEEQLRLHDPQTGSMLRNAEEDYYEEALQRQIAAEQRLRAEEQERIAQAERLLRIEQQHIAEEQRSIAAEERLRSAEQRTIAQTERERAAEQRIIAETERLRFDTQKSIAEMERLHFAEQKNIADEERSRAAEQRSIAAKERLRATEQERIAQEQKRRAEEERQRAETAEAELARVRAELDALRRQSAE